MNSNKVLGYALIVIGLLMIGVTAYQSYNIFYGQVSAPLIFRTQLPQQISGSQTSDVQKQINSAINQQLSQMIPSDTVSKILNLLSWSLFATILVLVGGAVAGIGVKLVK